MTRERLLADTRKNEAANITQCHALVDWFLDEVAFPDGVRVRRRGSGALTMTTLPLIGLSGRRTHGHRQEGYAQELHHLDLDLYFADYARAIIEAGGSARAPATRRRSRGRRRSGSTACLLTGGADIDPIRFDAERHPAVTMVERERDAFEFALLGEALHHELPVLGICRGLQVINVHLGGTLHQHVPEHSRYDVGVGRVRPLGRRSTTARSSARSTASRSTSTACTTRPSTGSVTDSGDGPSRGRHDRGHGVGDTIVAVQWHPEMMDSRHKDPVFRWIVEPRHGD